MLDDLQRAEEAAAEVQSSLISAREELELAKLLPEGAYLSPEAQALYEAEGLARFMKFHRRALRESLAALEAVGKKEGMDSRQAGKEKGE